MRFKAWLLVVQVVFALLFLSIGGMQLALPADTLIGPIPLPDIFMRCIGVTEVPGAVGLATAA